MIAPIETKSAPAPLGPYSQGVSAGPFIFVSSQIGSDSKTGKLVADDIERQTLQALDNITEVLTAAGASWHQVVRVELFFTDLRDFQVVNALYSERVQGMVQPARQSSQVGKLPLKARIAISCIAYKG